MREFTFAQDTGSRPTGAHRSERTVPGKRTEVVKFRSGTEVDTPEYSKKFYNPANTIFVSVLHEDGVRAWHAFLPRGAEGDLFSLGGGKQITYN